MFWENLRALCYEKGISPTRLTVELGLAQGCVPKWKNGAIPRENTLKKIAEYFGVSVSDLIAESLPTTTGAEIGDIPPELVEILEELKNRPDKRMLFQVLKNATPDDITKTVAIIEALKRTGL